MDTTVFASLRRSSTFLSILGYKSANGSVANYQLSFHTSYKEAVDKSLKVIEAFEISPEIRAAYPEIDAAKSELIASFQQTLATEDPVEAHYEPILDEDGNPIKGIKRHRTSGEVHLTGLINRKTTLVQGRSSKLSNKSAKTIAKDFLRGMTTVDRFRQFKLTPGNFREIRVEGHAITSEVA